MEKLGAKLKLPEHLCESDDPLRKAKAYSLNLLLLANQVGGKEMVGELISWLTNMDGLKLNSLLLKYEKQHRRAEKHIPYIRCSLQKQLIGTTHGGYKAQIQESSDVSVPREMDGFLFEDLEEALQNAGLRSDRFCEKCKSSAVSEVPLNLVSHSVDSLVNLFGVVLKNFKHSRIASLGSKDGALVYSAFLFSDAEMIESYEVDGKFRDIQSQVVNKYGMSSRVHIKSLKEFMNTDISKIDILICENIGDYDSEIYRERINAFVLSKKVLVCKISSGDECNSFLQNLIQLRKYENVMSFQEFFVIKQ